MPQLPKIVRFLWVVYFYTVFATGVIILFPFFWWGMRQPSRYPLVHRVRSYGCSTVLWLTGVRPDVQYVQPFDWPSQYIMVGNHTSIYDVVVGATLSRRELLFLGKAELKKVPLLGYFFRHMDVPVYRKSKEGARLSYQLAGKHLDRGANLIVFPEATTSKYAPKLLKFKKGAFKMAAERRIPIVPVTFVDNWWRYHYDEPWNGRPGRLRILIHPPHYPKGVGDEAAEELSEEIHHRMTKDMRDYFPDHPIWQEQ